MLLRPMLGLFLSIAPVSAAPAQLVFFQGSSADEAAWRSAVGAPVPIETFEDYTGTPDLNPTGDPIAHLPALGVTLETDVPGVFPSVLADAATAHSGVNQLSNVAAGAPQNASVRIRAMPGKWIRALGFWQSDPLSDQRMFVYAFNGFTLGSVTARVNDGSGMSFAGFVSSHPVAYVRLEGDFADGFIRIDDLQIVVEDICPADLAVDGHLDFYDVLSYLQIYSDGCP